MLNRNQAANRFLAAWPQSTNESAVETQCHTSANLQAVDTWSCVPMVSVLVAAWNEAAHIQSHIRSFESLNYPQKELIICAGGTDHTYDLATRLTRSDVTVLPQLAGEGKQRALQRCLEVARGSIIYLTDADCLLSTEAFVQLLEPLARGDAKVVTGMSLPRIDQRGNTLVQYQMYRDAEWSSTVPSEVNGVLGRNCALLRSVLDDIGGFETEVRTGTDYVLSRMLTRANYTIHSVPDSRVETDFPDSPRSYLHMWRRWNKNLLIHGVRFREWDDVKRMSTSTTLYGLMLGLPLLSIFIGRIALVLPALLFMKANSNRFSRMRKGAELTGSKVSWKNVVSLPLYTGLDAVAVLLAVRDAIDPRLRSRW